ncbi:hypothetical protein P7K49_037204 [Saguinus oedipus]|uniref:Uncharacterized protein n=1 Tax=Saguinus oedipus TaxID=9490 RepID=A0ABQ9THK6_SAGOE|nr:hypothetical protein P7K49_037204 [Saguinus oedipus]
MGTPEIEAKGTGIEISSCSDSRLVHFHANLEQPHKDPELSPHPGSPEPREQMEESQQVSEKRITCKGQVKDRTGTPTEPVVEGTGIDVSDHSDSSLVHLNAQY